MEAMDGARDMRRERALEVWPLARFSRNRPKVMKVISIVEVSKMVLGLLCGEDKRHKHCHDAKEEGTGCTEDNKDVHGRRAVFQRFPR